MFYAQSTYGEVIEFAAFETEREAATWLVDGLGPDYANDVWVGDNGKLVKSSRCLDFTVEVHASAEDAIVSNARLDPGSAARVLRALCDAIEASES